MLRIYVWIFITLPWTPLRPGGPGVPLRPLLPFSSLLYGRLYTNRNTPSNTMTVSELCFLVFALRFAQRSIISAVSCLGIHTLKLFYIFCQCYVLMLYNCVILLKLPDATSTMLHCAILRHFLSIFMLIFLLSLYVALRKGKV